MNLELGANIGNKKFDITTFNPGAGGASLRRSGRRWAVLDPGAHLLENSWC